MDAAVAEPCGLLRAGVFLLLLIFLLIVIHLTTDSLGLSSFLIWCPSSVQIEGGRMYQRKTNNPHLFSKIFGYGGASHKAVAADVRRRIPSPKLSASLRRRLPTSPLLDTSVSIVIMNAFVVFSFHFIPCNIGMRI